MAQARGAAAEQTAADFLVRQGVRIVGRNVRYKSGELDLICLDRDDLVFVEVRLRTHSGYGGAAQSVTKAKQRRIVSAARCWLAGEGRREAFRNCRFDVVLLDEADSDGIRWIRGAFDAP